MIPRCTFAALCFLCPLTCLVHGANINGEATYISFSVPGAAGTYTTSINASMTVTGYYYVANATPAAVRGFVRDADGAITTFDVGDAFESATPVWTIPESINAAGDITGFIQFLPVGPPSDAWVGGNQPQGFLRYADGRTVAIIPNLPPGNPAEGQPISINDFDDVAGNVPYLAPLSVFTRTGQGVYKDGISFNKLNVATAINASGTVVGFSGRAGSPSSGFVLLADGQAAGVNVPAQSSQNCAGDGTFPDGINAASAIAGWYVFLTNNCTTANTGGFVMSPDGVFSLFPSPGLLLAVPVGGFGGSLLAPHSISIDQAGDVTGSYTDGSGIQHGFVRNPYGTITSFDPPESKSTNVTTINKGGAIAGYYFYNRGSGSAVGFIRVP